MKFIGQTLIKREIEFLLKSVDNGENYNIMFRAPSGFGKTTLALICMHLLGMENSTYYLPTTDGSGLNPEFNSDKRIHCIDEAHILKIPEILYPIMDSKMFTVFILTNESGKLKEPLMNRCVIFNFHPYTDDEIIEMINITLGEFNLSNELIRIIATRCEPIPRIIKIVCTRLSYVFKNYLVPNNEEELLTILNEVLYIKEGGLTRLDEIYLDFLNHVGGQASLNTIVGGTGIDKNTILTEIEPRLLYIEKILITSKGRKLLNDSHRL